MHAFCHYLTPNQLEKFFTQTKLSDLSRMAQPTNFIDLTSATSAADASSEGLNSATCLRLPRKGIFRATELKIKTSCES